MTLKLITVRFGTQHTPALQLLQHRFSMVDKAFIVSAGGTQSQIFGSGLVDNPKQLPQASQPYCCVAALLLRGCHSHCKPAARVPRNTSKWTELMPYP